MVNDNFASKLAKKTFESEKVQNSWKIHMQYFSKILEPAFINNYQARVELTAALNLISNNNLKKGIKKLETIEHRCQSDEDHACWQYFMGLCFDMAGMKEETIHFYQAAGQYNHSFYLPYLKLAKYAHEDEVFDMAHKYYLKAIECLKEDVLNDQNKKILALAYSNLASCLTNMHLLHEAKETMKCSYDVLEDYKERAASEAILQAALGNKEEAYNHLEQVKQFVPQAYDLVEKQVNEILNHKHPHFNTITISKKDIQSFWNWFIDNENVLLKKLSNNSYDDVFAMIQFKLKDVFPFIEKQLDLAIEDHHDFYQIIFADYYMIALKDGYSELIKAMPELLKKQWHFDITR